MSDLTRLLQTLQPSPDGESAVRHRTALVDAVNADGTVDLDFDGTIIPDVSVLDGVVAGVGDVVQIAAWAGDLLVLGRTKQSAAATAWTTWTPSLVNLNVGTTGSVVARYELNAGTVFFDIHVTLGGTGISVGDCTFSVPVTENAGYNSGGDDRVQIGVATLIDAGIGIFVGVVTIDDGVFRPRYILTSGAAASQGTISSTVPFTWATGDRMWLHGWYETA